MVGKDLRRTWRSPLAVLAWLSFPLIFAGLIALTFGGEGSSVSGMPRVVVLVDDRDETTLSGLLASLLGGGRAAELFEIRPVDDPDEAEIERRFRGGEASALLRIPAGFQQDLLEARPLELELVRNPAQGILPEIAEQSTLVLADALDAAAHLFREPLDAIARAEDGGETTAAALTPLFAAVVEDLAPRLFPPAISIERVERPPPDGTAAEGQDDASLLGTIFLAVLPGVSVWALFMLGDHAMRDVLTEEKQGTLRRQLVGPLGALEIVAAKTLYAVTLAGLGLLLLAAIGWGVTGRTVDAVAFAALGLAVILAVAGLSAAIYGLARTERQGATLSSAVILAFAFIGGAFIPGDSLPEALRRFAWVSPIHWAIEGFRALEGRGAGVAEILPELGLLAGFGGALLLAGAALLGRRLRRAPA